MGRQRLLNISGLVLLLTFLPGGTRALGLSQLKGGMSSSAGTVHLSDLGQGYTDGEEGMVVRQLVGVAKGKSQEQSC